ncbi:hypothetical protein CJ738_33855 [Klebsiella pneumoniae]|nr:hypothetical protein CJ738_33855 [Klebsiella pneumoniae]
MKQEHNEADGGAHGLSASVSAADKPASASAGVGAKPDQSRSDSGVYTGLTMRHQCELYEKCPMPGVKFRTDA